MDCQSINIWSLKQSFTKKVSQNREEDGTVKITIRSQNGLNLNIIVEICKMYSHCLVINF